MTEYKKEAPELNVLHPEDTYTIEDLLGAILYNVEMLFKIGKIFEKEDRDRIAHCARRVWDLVPDENKISPKAYHTIIKVAVDNLANQMIDTLNEIKSNARMTLENINNEKP